MRLVHLSVVASKDDDVHTPLPYSTIGALAALISTNLQFSAHATPTAIAIVMEVPDYPGKEKLTKGSNNSSVKSASSFN